MRKILDIFNQQEDSIEEEAEVHDDFDHIVVEIIDDVVKK